MIEPTGALRRQYREPDGRVEERRLRLVARGAGELERCRVMAGEELRAIREASARGPLEPLGDGGVLARPGGARDLRVGDVPDEAVPEGVFDVPPDRRAPHAPDELLAPELVQTRQHRLLGRAADRDERSGREDLADDGGVVQERL